MALAFNLWGAALASLSLLADATRPIEWYAVFDMDVGLYTWSFTKKSGPDPACADYADESMRFLFVPTASKDGITNTEMTSAEAKWDDSTVWEDANSYGDLEVDTKYTLVFDPQTWTTHFTVHVDVEGPYAFYLEHFPYEFEEGFHFLQDAAGTDVEPTYEIASDDRRLQGHDHGGGEEEEEEEEEEEYVTPCPWTHDWEWSAVFPVSCCSDFCYYDWNMQKVNGEYADAAMDIVLLAADDAHIDEKLAEAKTTYDAIDGSDAAHDDHDDHDHDRRLAADDAHPGDVLDLDRGYRLHLETNTWASHFKIKVPKGTTHLAVFAQHYPIEFEKYYHYLKDHLGQDIEPLVESAVGDCEDSEDPSRWGEVILSTFITVLPTLLSLFVIAKACAPQLENMASGTSLGLSIILSCCSGVIFAAAVFLLLPEGLHMVSVDKTEAEAAAIWGSAIMSSWLFSVILKHSLTLTFGDYDDVLTPMEEQNKVQTMEGGERAAETPGTRWKVASIVLLGDMFHNFSDGLVIGLSFRLCKPSFGWKLTLVTVLHEAPQEIADFAVLVTRGRMHWTWATLLNFLSGLSTVIGGIITYGADVSTDVEGFLLAAGAGMYLYVAMTEIGPVVANLTKGDGPKGSLARLAAFALGALVLGLILLDHEHCGGDNLLESAAGEDPHAGHNH